MFVACDESGINPSDKYLVIGSVWMTKKDLCEFEKKVTRLRLDKKCWGEIEWYKLSNSASKEILSFYKDFIDLAFNEVKAFFRFVIVEKKLLDTKKYHQNSNELVILKFMHLSLSRYAETFFNLETKKRLHIVYDSFTESGKSREDKWRIRMREYIEHHLGCEIDHLQPCNSHICSLIQLSDLFTGAISTVWNKSDSEISSTKSDLIGYMEKVAKKKFAYVTQKNEKDFNVWGWKPYFKSY